MTGVLDVVLPVFGILFLGYGAARGGFFDEGAQRGLGLFVFNFAIPILLFRTLAQTELPPDPPWGLLLSYYLGAIGVFVLGMLGARLLGHQGLDMQAILGFGGCFSNTVQIGMPLILKALGERATLPLFLVIAFHGLLLITLLTVIMELARGSTGSLRQLPLNTARGLLTNPIVVGLLLGLGYNLLGWPLPTALERIAATMGQAVVPCALFSMGAGLSRYRIAGNLREALLLVGLKNFLHPLLVYLLATRVFHLNALWLAVVLLLAALPVGVNPFLFAQRYRVGVPAVTTAIVISTALSVLTLSVLLVWLQG